MEGGPRAAAGASRAHEGLTSADVSPTPHASRAHEKCRDGKGGGRDGYAVVIRRAGAGDADGGGDLGLSLLGCVVSEAR